MSEDEQESASPYGRAEQPGDDGRPMLLARPMPSSFLGVSPAYYRSQPVSEFAEPRAAHEEAVRDGRYSGGTERFRIELRADAAVSRILSADMFARAVGGSQVWLASLRTRPGEPFEPTAGVWAIIATDRNGDVSDGRLSLRQVTATDIQAELTFVKPLEGLPWQHPILIGIQWQSNALRRLGLEIEQEEGVEPPPQVLFNDTPMSIQHALANAGFDTWAAGLTDQLPPPFSRRETDCQMGWSEKDLEGLMRDFAQTALDRPSFELRLLWLSRSNRPGLLGIMFDSEDALQRQGVAVFAEEIRAALAPAEASRKLIQTTVHEIGHALNLAHRFERVVGRADSTSFMNYDWRYAGGGRADEFWLRFAYTFDEDELSFLRHGPLPALVPGGNAFRSARYWADGNGGYSPYLNEAPLPGIRLELLPPGTEQAVFAFGQPVLLGVRLTNTGAHPIRVTSYLLDPKAGFIEITIRRLDLADRDRRDVRSFTPIIARCFDVAADQVRVLRPGESLSDNLNLTFGAAGFPFAEPGFYEVQAFLVIYEAGQEREFIAPSGSLRLRVSAPHSADDEHDAMVLFAAASGRYFVLGGTTQGKAEDNLEDVLERRIHRERQRKRRSDPPGVRDPVAVNIIRSRAFRLGRNYHARVDRTIKLVQHADPDAALRELGRLDDVALATFDPVTAADTKTYRQNLMSEA